MKRLYALLVLALFSTCLIAQTNIFTKKYSIWNEMSMNNFQQTSDGGYILSTDAIPEMDPVTYLGKGYLIKINPQGVTSWIKSYPKTNAFIKSNDGCSVFQTNDGGYIIGTEYYDSTSNPISFYSTSICLIKTDNAGNFQWSKHYTGKGTSTCWCVKQTSDSGYIVCGGTIDTSGTPATYAYLLKTDNAGNIQWGKTYAEITNGNSRDAYCVNQTTDGGYVLCGEGHLQGAFILKTDNTGNISWSASYGNYSYDAFQCVRQTSDGGYITAGYDLDTINSTFYRSLAMKFDSAGNLQWSKAYHTSNSISDIAVSVQEISSGRFAFAIQQSDSSSQNPYPGIMVTDSSGNVIWTKMYTNVIPGSPSYLEKTTDNGFAFPTYFYDIFYYFEPTVVKCDSNGIASCKDSAILVSSVNYLPAQKTGLFAGNATAMNIVSTVLSSVIVADSSLCPAQDGIVAFSSNENSISIFPNPSNGNFNFHLDQLSGENIDFKIYDVMGKIILQKKEENIFGALDENFDLRNFSDGIYFVAVKVGNGNVFVKKIVKSE